MSQDPEVLTKIDELLAAIGGYSDPRRAMAEWKQVYRLLQKTDLPAGRVTAVVGMRDVAGLNALAEQLRSPQPAPPPAQAPAEDVCREALKAFRKRLAATILDEQSTLTRSPLSKGDGRTVQAMVPPIEWPPEVWRELVRQGKLRDIGHGLYEVVKQQ